MFNKKGFFVMFFKFMINIFNGGFWKVKNCGYEDMVKEEFFNKYKWVYIMVGLK